MDIVGGGAPRYSQWDMRVIDRVEEDSIDAAVDRSAAAAMSGETQVDGRSEMLNIGHLVCRVNGVIRYWDTIQEYGFVLPDGGGQEIYVAGNTLRNFEPENPPSVLKCVTVEYKIDKLLLEYFQTERRCWRLTLYFPSCRSSFV